MQLVVDASALAEYLIASPVGIRVRQFLEQSGADLHIPHLAVVETTSVLRSWVRRGDLSESRAAGALQDLVAFPARRWPVEPMLEQVWELRDNVTAYNATYLALAEALDAELLTGDARLARAIQARGLSVQVCG